MLLTYGVEEDSWESQPVYPKWNQPWIFIGGTDAKAETLIFWLPDVKNWLIWKESDSGNDWRWEEKGTTEDEMVGWHHQLNGREAWCAIVHGVRKSLIWLNNWTELKMGGESGWFPRFLPFLTIKWIPLGLKNLELKNPFSMPRVMAEIYTKLYKKYLNQWYFSFFQFYGNILSK